MKILARTAPMKVIFRRITLALLGTLAWCLFLDTQPGESFEFSIHSSLVRARGTLPAPQDVVIVSIDEETFRTLELPMDRPLPREVHAKLIRKLASLGASRVVFDVVFAGRSAREDWDNALASSLESMPVILGAEFGLGEQGGNSSYTYIEPDPFLSSKVAALALVTMRTEEGVARFFYTPSKHSPPLVTLSEAAAGLYTPDDRKKHVLPSPHDLINYYGPSRSIKTYSIAQIIEEEVPFPAHLIRGKSVFVGLNMRTGLGAMQKDSFQTPFGEVFGVEIHATQAANIINKNWIRRPSIQEQRLVGGVICFLLCLLVVSLRPLASILVTLGSAAGWIITAYLGIQVDTFVAGAGIVLLTIPTLCLINTVLWYLRTRKRQKEIEGAFSCYLSPAMVKELKRNPNLLKLGGEELVCTAIFTDIKGFTTLGEQLGPMRLVSMLNAYFSKVTDAVTDEGGTVIKFIGDAVFGIWNAPLPQADHAERAARAALRIQKVVEEFNATGEYPPLVTRVGVNTGKMVVGNLGSKSRFDYTAIGDTVNIAARIEGVNKYLGTTVLISEETLSHIPSHNLPLQKMGAIGVVGRAQPLMLYALLEEPLSPQHTKLWEEALTAFSSKQWELARNLFSNVKASCETLAEASNTYLHAIDSLSSGPEDLDWRGELRMDSK